MINSYKYYLTKNKIGMESLRVFRLPCDFKPVARICAEIERGFLTEMASFMKLQEKSYITVLGDMEQDTIDIKDDVEFIVNLQNEFDIANETAQEKAEWYYTLASCRTIETLAEIKLKYNQYINTIAHFESNPYSKIIKIKDYILNYYNCMFKFYWRDLYINIFIAFILYRFYL